MLTATLCFVSFVLGAMVYATARECVRQYIADRAFKGHAGYQKRERGAMVFVSYFGHEVKAHRIAQNLYNRFGFRVLVK